jgi:hypothetical protein
MEKERYMEELIWGWGRGLSHTTLASFTYRYKTLALLIGQ